MERSRRNYKGSFAYNEMETRLLLATVSNELFNDFNAIVITGTNADDVVDVSYEDASQDSVEITLNGEEHTFEGVEDIERLVFMGLPGDDTFVNNTSLNATVFGHEGDDHLTGGSGHNRIQGGKGNDTIIGGDKADFLRGRAGNDEFFPGGSRDKVHGGTGNDLVHASAGKDRIYGGEGDDTLNGGFASDRISGGPGNDTINFGTGVQDVALLDQAFTEYDIAREGNSLVISSGNEGVEDLNGAETLRFDRFSDDPVDREASNFFVEFDGPEQTVFDLISEFREGEDLSALVPVNDISEFAENWTRDVLLPLGRVTGQDLVDNHSTVVGGYMPIIIGGRVAYTEISGFYPDPNATGEEAMSIIFNGVSGFPGSGWIDSPFHLSNFSAEEAYEIGIGVAKNSHGWYVTVGFGLKSLPT